MRPALHTLMFSGYPLERVAPIVREIGYDGVALMCQPPHLDLDDPVKSALIAKVIREIEPIAGKIDYDIEGTIAGTWFLDGTVDYRGNVPVGTPRYWDGHLYIGYGYIDPTQIRISIGFDTGISNDLCNIGNRCVGRFKYNAGEAVVRSEMNGNTATERFAV